MFVTASTANAKAFLADAVPWPIEGGLKFYVNIHHAFVMKDGDGQPRRDSKGRLIKAFPGRAFINLQSAVRYVEWLNTLDNAYGRDIYVCMSAQAKAEPKVTQMGRTNFAAVRDADNAVLFRGLWIDVDVKPGDPQKGYVDQREAATEFGRIRRALALPMPSMLVASGTGGFHAHWTFAEPVGRDVWEPLAFALVTGFLTQGFRGDTGCTVDAARLLRVPDTFNMKHVEAGTGPKLPVRLLTRSGNTYMPEVFQKALQTYINAAPVRPTPAVTQTLIQGAPPAALASSTVSMSSLGSGVEAQSTTVVPVQDVANACPFVLRSLQTGGAANNNPLWMATCRMAIFLQEGDDAAHWMAQSHKDYAYADTQYMIERVRAEHAARNLGWPRCENIKNNGAPECATCPHNGKNKSPFNFATPPGPSPAANPAPAGQAQAAALAPLPNGYSYTPLSQIEETVTDEDGNQHKELVTEFAMLDPWMQEHPATLNFTTVTGGTLGGNDEFRRQVRVPMSVIQEKAALIKTLAEQHMVFPINRAPAFSRFLVSWIEQLRKDRQRVVQSVPFGWYKPNGQITGFIYAKQVHSKGAPKPASNPDPVLERQYSPTGDLDPWRIAAKMITDQKRPPLDAILASAFAAPLVSLVGQTGLLMSTYSPESGIGKSTTMRIAQGVWGNPVKAVQSLSDTQNSVIKKVGDLKNLPMYWDELKTNVDTERFVAIAFQLAQGKEKSRMASDTTYREPGTWETMMVSTSNDSIRHAITQNTKTTGAGIARIFEFQIPPGVKGQIDLSKAQQITAAVNDNYGNAGLIYAKWLGANYEQIAVEVDAKLHEIERRFQVRSEERFWLSLIVVLLMGAHYANKLGLTEIDEPSLYRFVTDEFQNQRTQRSTAEVDLSSASSLSSHLAAFLNEKKLQYTIVTNYIWSMPGRPPVYPSPAAISARNDPKGLREVQVQIGKDTGQIRIMRYALYAWLEEQNISRKLFIDYLKSTFNATEKRGSLGTGIDAWQTVSDHVIDIDGRSSTLQPLLDL